MTVPVDQAARDRAATALDASLTLSAGAGSGKTTVLTARVLALLESGVPPGRIAAITFTEKAAGELQARVRDALELQVASTGQSDAVLEGLPELTLSTIHSFCRQLLVAEALVARWAPDTEILPDAIKAAEVHAAYQRWRRGFSERHRDASLVLRRIVNPRTLRQGAADLLSFRDLEPLADPRGFAFGPAHAELAEVAAELEAAAARCTRPDDDKLLAGNARLRALLARAVRQEPNEAVVGFLGSGEVGKRGGGRRQDWDDGGKQAFLDARQRLEDWRDGQHQRLHGLVVRDLVEHFVPTVDEAKRRAGVGDYDDLLFRAAELLSRHPAARRRLARRYDAVLIDEVQDTDPIQAEVAALLTRPPIAEGRWNAHAPEPGRLFAVGDPCQSIYRFRRADVATWAELQQLVGADSASLTLTQNFRSVPGIVDWVNTTFQDLPGYTPQAAARAPACLEPVVRLATAPEREVEDIARYLWSIKAEGQVVDRDTGAPRPLRWSDVMVLLPSWSSAEVLQAGLARAGIEALVEGGGAFFERDEVRCALAALRCIEEPADQQSTVLVLRGWFGLTWEALARHRAAGGAWRSTVPDPPPGPVAEAFRLLRALSRQRGRVPFGQLLDRLAEHTRAATVWALRRDGAARLANLDKFRALVRRVEAAARSPGDTLRRLDELAREPEKELSRNDLDSDAVHVTSYFKAKGLEAPVVVLACARRSRDGVRTAVWRGDRRVAIRISPLVPPDWGTWEEREKAAQHAERDRWLYVATTRARDQLVFADHEQATLIDAHLVAGRPTARTVAADALPEIRWRDETFPGLDGDVDAWLDAPPAPGPDATVAWQTELGAATARARASSVRWRSVLEIASRERVSRATSPVGVAGGLLVHDVMAAVDLAQPLEVVVPQVDALIASFAAGRGVDAEVAAACAEIVRGMLRHPVIDEARAAPERWVEVPFSIPDRGRMVSGRLDLAFPTAVDRRHWVVVDWKSEVPPEGSPARRNYERQLQLYAQALLKTVSPCESVTTLLVGPYPSLGARSAQEEALGEVVPELAPGLHELLEAGVAVPGVGVDAGEPIVAQAELAWVERRVALLVGRPADEHDALTEQGWQVVSVAPTGPTWGPEAMAELHAVLRPEPP